MAVAVIRALLCDATGAVLARVEGPAVPCRRCGVGGRDIIKSLIAEALARRSGRTRPRYV